MVQKIDRHTTRRGFLTAMSALGAGLALNEAGGVDAAGTGPSMTGSQALNALLQGNLRFVRGAPTHLNQSIARRQQVAHGQHPFAIIISCSDSRVPPEILFDQGLGDLFVVRTAGNVADDIAIGSIEYAVHHFHSPLLMVLAHTRCGAVIATVKGGRPSGSIGSIVSQIEPAVLSTAHMPGDHVVNATVQNARNVAGLLQARSKTIHNAHAQGKMAVVAAEYNLDSGAVRTL